MSKFPLRKRGWRQRRGGCPAKPESQGKSSGHSRCNALGKAFRKSQDNPRAATPCGERAVTPSGGAHPAEHPPVWLRDHRRCASHPPTEGFSYEHLPSLRFAFARAKQMT